MSRANLETAGSGRQPDQGALPSRDSIEEDRRCSWWKAEGSATIAPIASSARFSPGRRHRYSLWRRWGDGPAACNFLLLNPSKADERADYPTIARCRRRARAWGFDSLVVTNLFALRATDSRGLRQAADPIGPDNDAAILTAARSARLVVCGWGVHGPYRGRAAEVLAMLAGSGIAPACLGRTAGGEPRHPLHLPYDVALRPLLDGCPRIGRNGRPHSSRVDPPEGGVHSIGEGVRA